MEVPEQQNVMQDVGSMEVDDPGSRNEAMLYFLVMFLLFFNDLSIPGTCSLFLGETTLQKKAQTPIKTRVIWVPGVD